MAMTTEAKVMEAARGLSETYNEALNTYGLDVSVTALAYVAAAAVHTIEHDPRLANVPHTSRQAQATGVWANAFHEFLKLAREMCGGGRRVN